MAARRGGDGRSPTSNDVAWGRAIDALGLDARVAVDGFADVTAAELKRRGGREPRLMAKIDHAGQLPAPLGDRGWGILPTRRGAYRIGPFGMFADLPDPPELAHPLTLPGDLETVRAGGSLAEPAALFLLQSSGALAEFAGEPGMTLTSFGRRGTGPFSFRAGGVPVDVDRAQIEIDALLEGTGSIAVVEAKREGDGTWVLRQLFYPWRALTAEYRKPVRPMYLEVGDTGLRLMEFAFGDPGAYAPPRLVSQRRWVFAAESWRDATLEDLAAGPAVPEPEGVPFPQADSVDRLLAFIAAVGDGRGSREELGQECAFVDRQVDYYGNAARYLGFLDGAPGRQVLTDAGRELLAADPSERSFPVARAVLAHEPFRRLLEQGRGGESAEAVVADARPDLGAATVRRRARTARAWIAWLEEREAVGRGGLPPAPGGAGVLF